jgi:guanyl-specific ribonuclease Sa
MKGRFPTWLALALAAGALVALIVLPSGGDKKISGTTATATISSSEHAEIARILTAVGTGAPLPYSQDGEVFENREGLLPAKPSGYYHAYTVPTPGSQDRGARRLIVGTDGDVWYTSDHYGSFEPIDPKDYK